MIKPINQEEQSQYLFLKLKFLIMKKSPSLVVLSIGLLIFSASCRKSINTSEPNNGEAILEATSVKIPGLEKSESKYNTFYGPVVQMGNGHARSWINVSDDNKALAL